MGELTTQSTPEPEAVIDEATVSKDDNPSNTAISGEVSESSTQELDPALFDQYFEDFLVSRRR